MINSVPASGVSFKGAEAPEDKKQLSAAEIKQKSDEFAKSVDAASQGVKDVTESVTGAVATVGGATSMIGGAVNKIIPKSVKEFFTKVAKDPQTGEVLKDEAGKIIRKADWKKLGIAGGIAAAVTAATVAIVCLVKNNKAKQAEAAKQAQFDDNFVKEPTAEEVDE